MSDTRPRERITVYSDYVCPFCYLGRQSLSVYQTDRDDPLEIDWRPFDLRAGRRGPDGEIDPDADDGKDEDYYQQARENVRRLANEYDVDMAQEIATDVDSRPAQIASYHVSETEPYETWLAFDEAVFEALWLDGRDIGDRDVLVDCATDAGLTASVVDDALSDTDLDTRLDRLFEEANAEGITGVPTFAYDGHAARGAVPPAQLARLVDGT
ncbi:DsbA family oxidoreductase [Haloplanus sp.]|uniref:DsbA family oxidoreductase n=1 Tax=Haloplanus sp. TaxID=1961696 RepID=UPI002637AD14|nr:DsbA family protein [Haloplanus sp.]